MPARKNRPDKHGHGEINRIEQEYLHYWFTEGRNESVWVGPDDVVHGIHGFDSGKGQLVRGLVTKGYLERKQVQGDPDWVDGANVRYSLTEQGRKYAPNAR